MSIMPIIPSSVEGTIEIPLKLLASLGDALPEATRLCLYLNETKGIAALLDQAPAHPHVVTCERLSAEKVALLACLCLFPQATSLEMLFACSAAFLGPCHLLQPEENAEATRERIVAQVLTLRRKRGGGEATSLLTEHEQRVVFQKISKLRVKMASFGLECFFKDQAYRLVYTAHLTDDAGPPSLRDALVSLCP